MKLDEIFSDKNLKQKAKTELLSSMIQSKKLSVDEIISYSKKLADKEKASCIEALEFATRKDPTLANDICWKYITDTLLEEAPRLKWESAKVAGNIAHLFQTKLSKTITNLLTNSENSGTVVRWASAFALGEILKLKTKYNKELLPAIEAICTRESDNGVKKKYLEAIKKLHKP